MPFPETLAPLALLVIPFVAQAEEFLAHGIDRGAVGRSSARSLRSRGACSRSKSRVCGARSGTRYSMSLCVRFLTARCRAVQAKHRVSRALFSLSRIAGARLVPVTFSGRGVSVSSQRVGKMSSRHAGASVRRRVPCSRKDRDRILDHILCFESGDNASEFVVKMGDHGVVFGDVPPRLFRRARRSLLRLQHMAEFMAADFAFAFKNEDVLFHAACALDHFHVIGALRAVGACQHALLLL